MTRKARLQVWAAQLGSDLPDSATAAQFEAAIESALSTEPAAPTLTLRQGIAANWAVVRSELPSTITAVVLNLRGIE